MISFAPGAELSDTIVLNVVTQSRVESQKHSLFRLKKTHGFLSKPVVRIMGSTSDLRKELLDFLRLIVNRHRVCPSSL
jgi:hypothetical protein